MSFKEIIRNDRPEAGSIVRKVTPSKPSPKESRSSMNSAASKSYQRSSRQPKNPHVDDVYKVLVDVEGDLVRDVDRGREEVKVKVFLPDRLKQLKLDFEDKRARILKEDRDEEMPKFLSDLKKFNEDEEDRRFAQKLYDCGVCFTEKMGKDCFRFLGKFSYTQLNKIKDWPDKIETKL